MLDLKINPYNGENAVYRGLKKNSFYVFSLSVILAACIHSSSAFAYPDSYNAYGYSPSNNNTTAQPKIRWYRYYGPNGQPSLSSTITAQHLQYGYEALDRNMQIIRKVPPYSADQYAKQKAQRDALMAQREADLELRKNYGSAAQAANKRDTILADMSSRKAYLQTQLVGLQASLNSKITQAASFERQKKPVPAYLQASLKENRENVEEAQRNVQSIELRQQQIKDEYNRIIQRLNNFGQ